jgi:signal transduction histidine kinase
MGGLVITTERVGDRVYESRKFPVELTDGRLGVGGYVRDVTEQRRAEGEIRRLATELERRVEQRTAQLAATNRELESFAYSISHDLRAPLRALDGFSEILLQDYGAVIDETGRGYLRRIKGAANHMAGLMDGLLQLSRLNREALVLEDVDLTDLARSVVTDLREQDPDRTVDVLVEPGLHAEADPKLLRVVLVNLLGNAWKFTARHETARIEVGAAQHAEGENGGGDGGGGTDGIAFYVKDDGAGFDPRYARNLFGAFQRLHTPDQFEGTGIGLATVQRIVHRHGGAVWAEGEVEKGATFWFTLGATDAG